MTNARSNFGRELAAVSGLILALAPPVFVPMMFVILSPHASPPEWVFKAGLVVMAGMMLSLFAGIVLRMIPSRRKRRSFGNPLHRLQDWKDAQAIVVPEADEYDRWRGTLVDRISIWLNPPIHRFAASLLRVLILLTSLLWLWLCFGLYAPGLLGLIDPYDRSLNAPYLAAVGLLTGVMVMGNAWLWASQTRREIDKRAS